MRDPHNPFLRFLRTETVAGLRLGFDLFARAAQIVPEAWDRLLFRRFWGEGSLLAGAYFVMDSYEAVSLRHRFRRAEELAECEFLYTFTANAVIEGAFSPQAPSMLTALFSRHSGKALRVVTDEELSPTQQGALICYGASDSNRKTFDVEASTGGSLCQFLFDATGERAFRLAEQRFAIERRDGVTYDKAIVLRVTDNYEANHSRVVCAGLSEWGSLAAVYYLTTHWKDLHKRFDSFGRRKDFCVLLEVPCGQVERVREVVSAVSWRDPERQRCFCADIGLRGEANRGHEPKGMPIE